MKLIRQFYPEETITKTLPLNIKKGDEVCFGEMNYKIQPSGLYHIKNVKISPIGIIYQNFISLKKFIICYEIDFKKYRLKYFLKSLLKFKKITLPEKTAYLIVFDNYSGPNGFAHWLCDGLPKVAEMNEELDKYTLLLPPYFKTNSLYLDTLSFFKIQKTEYLKEETLTTAPDLYVASHLASTGNFNPKNIKKLRDIVLPQITEPLVKNEYIYISRAKTNKRFVENENQITNYLTENNFKIIYSEEYSFKEQLQIVYNAKVVVTIHGAALALTMFMKKGTHVLEFRKNKDTINNMYYSLCQAAGINYSYLFCESKEISEVGNNFNLIVDPKELKIALDKIRQ